MQENPYSAAICRFFLIAGGSIGSVVFVSLIIWSLATGHVPAMSRGGTAGPGYYAAINPSQFWFSLFLYAIMALASGWTARCAYRQ